MSTLYVSPDDQAVKKSFFIHKNDRVGFSPPVVVREGIETINVEQKMTKALWNFGHSYHADAETLLYDLRELILYSSGADKRAKLEKVTSEDNKTYWELQISS